MLVILLQQVADPWEFVSNVIPLVLSSVAIAISLLVFYLTRPIEKKQLQFAVLAKLFETLSSIELSNARRAVFHEYCKVYRTDRSDSAEKRKRLLEYYDKIKEDVRKVEGAFDQAGVLVLQKQVNRKLFFDLYALMVIRTFRALQAHIESEQAKTPAFALWYKKLYIEALDHYANDLKMEPEAIYCEETKTDTFT